MSILVFVAMFGWIPVILLIFSLFPPVRALVISFVVGWCYLPRVNFPLSGVPDFDKVVATTCGVLLAAMIFDMGRLMTFRFQWYDLPMAAWCVAPILAVWSTGVDFYEGFAATERQIVCWAVPYFLGRVYLNTLEDLRELALGLVIGGLSYAPLCLYEVRFSPNLNQMVYGFSVTAWEGTRYNGFRPRVFTANGLECGMWLAVTMMAAYRCWARGSIRTLWGWPFGYAVAILAVTTILGKATGAIVLLVVGLVLLWLVRVTRSALPIWVLIILPFIYIGTRSSGIWSGRQLTDFAASNFGQDRADSIQFRFDCENLLIEKANIKALFGWGMAGRGRITDENGRDMVITDGLWIITYGDMGMFGVISLFLCFNLPIVVLLRRIPAQQWADPMVAPAASLAVILGLYSLDNLSNAMPSPIYALIAGGISSVPAFIPRMNRSHLLTRIHQGDALFQARRPEEAIMAYQEAISAAPSLIQDSASLRELALLHSRMAELREMYQGFPAAEVEWRKELDLREMLAMGPDGSTQDHRDFAEALDHLGRNLTEQGRSIEAIEYRRRSVTEFAVLASSSSDDHDRWVLGLNDLAWLLATAEDPDALDPEQAVLLAERATIESPSNGTYWNTLGVAQFRAGDNRAAITALERSIELGTSGGGGTAFDLLFLAMARLGEGDTAPAREALRLGEDWMDRFAPGHPALTRFREEARLLFPDQLILTSQS